MREMSNEDNFTELRKKVLYANDIDDEIDAWEEIDRRLILLDEIQRTFKIEDWKRETIEKLTTDI